jgi:hypothetical protein
MTSDPDAEGRACYLIRVTGIVGKRLLGSSTALSTTAGPPCTILHVEAEGEAAEVAARLQAHGLDVLTIRKLTSS